MLNYTLQELNSLEEDWFILLLQYYVIRNSLSLGYLDRYKHCFLYSMLFGLFLSG